jgi:hypothetical protein
MRALLAKLAPFLCLVLTLVDSASYLRYSLTPKTSDSQSLTTEIFNVDSLILVNKWRQYGSVEVTKDSISLTPTLPNRAGLIASTDVSIFLPFFSFLLLCDFRMLSNRNWLRKKNGKSTLCLRFTILIIQETIKEEMVWPYSLWRNLSTTILKAMELVWTANCSEDPWVAIFFDHRFTRHFLCSRFQKNYKGVAVFLESDNSEYFQRFWAFPLSVTVFLFCPFVIWLF